MLPPVLLLLLAGATPALAGAQPRRLLQQQASCAAECQDAQRDALVDLLAQLRGAPQSQILAAIAQAPSPGPEGLPAHCSLPGVLCCAASGSLVRQLSCSAHALPLWQRCLTPVRRRCPLRRLRWMSQAAPQPTAYSSSAWRAACCGALP